jgi:hypothetical protein
MKSPTSTKKGSGRVHQNGYSRKKNNLQRESARLNLLVKSFLASGQVAEAANILASRGR